MLRVTILSTPRRFANEFERCCGEYKTLCIAAAWCGNPRHCLPYSYLETLRGRIIATIGTSFNHTHPDSIELLRSLKADVRIFRDGPNLFHPKLYSFSSGHRIALFIGSSNLTYSGFFDNIEANILLEGVPDARERTEVSQLQKQIRQWHSVAYSFVPSLSWLASYRTAFQQTADAERKYRIETPPRYEEEIGAASWLRHASWKTYYKMVLKGLKKLDRSREGYLYVLSAARNELPVPWTPLYFRSLEKRRLIEGIGTYGWLGHVGASGQFRRLLAAGSSKETRTIADVLNQISAIDAPVDWDRLRRLLNKLIGLGQSMKVWGRLLCLVRPELYCTVASDSVRNNLSKTLKLPKILFQRPDGYIQLLTLIHASPWFNSPKPTGRAEAEVWGARVAFMDAIFYP